LLSNVTVSKRKERGREEGGRESLPIGGNENTDLLNKYILPDNFNVNFEMLKGVSELSNFPKTSIHNQQENNVILKFHYTSSSYTEKKVEGYSLKSRSFKFQWHNRL
jgi:hypothetical protein